MSSTSTLPKPSVGQRLRQKVTGQKDSERNIGDMMRAMYMKVNMLVV